MNVDWMFVVGLLYCGTSFVVRGGEGIEMDAEKDFDGEKLFLGEKGALSTTIYMMYCFYILVVNWFAIVSLEILALSENSIGHFRVVFNEPLICSEFKILFGDIHAKL